MTRLEDHSQAVGEWTDLPISSTRRRHHRRWPWVVGAFLILIAAFVAVMVLTPSRARPVSMQQAETQLGRGSTDPLGDSRPVPGVYRYTGSGTDSLSLPPLSQPEGPTMPGTVTLEGANCWDFRIDYSTHHWETWDYCLGQGGLRETGGRLWQLWSIGPINVTNMTSITCSPGTVAVPTHALPQERWAALCTGTSTAVKGRMVSAGPYQFVGTVTMSVGRSSVRAAHFLELRTDSGAQRGTERTGLWLSESNGLPLRVQQDIKVTTATPFGTSRYTQVGVFTLASLVPHH
jgi:hypothetical protein